MMTDQERMATNVARRIETQRAPISLQAQRESAMRSMAPAVLEISKGVDYDPAEVQAMLILQQLRTAADIGDMAIETQSPKLMEMAMTMAEKAIRTAPEVAGSLLAQHADLDADNALLMRTTAHAEISTSSMSQRPH